MMQVDATHESTQQDYEAALARFDDAVVGRLADRSAEQIQEPEPRRTSRTVARALWGSLSNRLISRRH